LIVVLEGPDFAGKSTIANRLVSRFGGEVRWVGQPPQASEVLDFYLDMIHEAASQGTLTVFDRMHVSELVYGPLFRGVSRLPIHEADQIETELETCGAIKVHVDAPDSVLTERLRGPRGDQMVQSEDRLLDVAHAYRSLLSGENAPLRWLVMSYEDLVTAIERRLH